MTKSMDKKSIDNAIVTPAVTNNASYALNVISGRLISSVVNDDL
ncbi:hypothetical protein [Xenorhabdus doucetiae]|nr:MULTISPECIES: hypothetical protein [unclassified Xenorhabdus]